MFNCQVKGIDSGYKLIELLSGRGGSAEAVNVTAVEFRFGAVVLNWCSQKIGVAGSHFSARGHAISLIIVVVIE